jgi:zinc protease
MIARALVLLPLPVVAALLAACASSAHRSLPAPAAGAAEAGGEGPVLAPRPEDPAVSLAVWFRAGAQDDPPGKEGLAFLTGSLIDQGSTAKRSYTEILAALFPMAAGYSMRVDKEMTTFSGRTHRDNLDAYLDLFESALLAPKFDPADFERLKSDQRNYLEKTLRYASDEDLGKAALQSLVFAGTRYAHPPEGTVQGLAAITLEDVRSFHRRHFTRDNAVVAVGGGYPPELLRRLPAAIDRLPPGRPAAAEAPTLRSGAGREVMLVAKPGADASVSVGLPLAVRRGERDFYALWLANSWLGEHRNAASHLYQVIRETRGLNYGDYSYVEWFPEGGRRQFPPGNVGRRRQLFELWIRTLPNEQALFALRAALRELTRLAEQGLSEEEFETTRAFLGKYALHYADTVEARLGFALDDRFYGLSGDGHLARLRQALATLTRDEVNAALRRHLKLDELKLAIVTGEAEAMRDALTSGAPTPITYASEKPPEVLAEDREIAAFPLKIAAEKIRIVPVDEIFER